MKKALIAAFVAVMAFAVQAVTASWWTTVKTFNPSEQHWQGSLKNEVSPYIGADFSVRITYSYTHNNSKAWKTLAGLVTLTNNRFDVQNTGTQGKFWSGKFTGEQASEEGVVSDVGFEDGKDFSIMFTYDSKNDVLRTWVNDTNVAEFSNVTINPDEFDIGIGKGVAGGRDVGQLDNWKVKKVEVISQNVPEPTVLALLALGIAGLALKRNVA